MSYPDRNKGVALVTALLVVSIASTAAITLSARQQLDIRRTANLIDGDQAWLYAMGAEAWSEAILARDLKDNKFDGLQDTWAKKLPPIELPGGGMIGIIEDMQGRFNINNLLQGEGKVDAVAIKRFETLLKLLELDQNLGQAVIDWLDKDIEATPPNGAEDDHYLGLKTPYLAANRKMENVSELRLIKGFNPTVYERVAPFVTALPKRTKINVNTAPAEVLASLSPGLSLELAKNLVAERNEKPYEKVGDFTGHEVLKQLTQQNKNGSLNKNIGVTSNYFMLHTDVRIANARASLDSLIFRDKGKLKILQRSQRLLRIGTPTDRQSKDREGKS